MAKKDLEKIVLKLVNQTDKLVEIIQTLQERIEALEKGYVKRS